MTSAAKPGGCLFEAKKQTCLAHFGCESHNSNLDIQAKKRATFRATLGVDNPFQSTKIKEAIQEKMLVEHGVRFSSQIAKSRVKFKQTCLERYGFENPLQSEEVKQRSRKTCIERYGVPYPLQNEEVYKKNFRSRHLTTIIHHWKTNDELICTASYEVAFVNWCNTNQVDFNWQIPHKMPNNRTYFIDAFITSGEFENTWIEIKGFKSEGGMKKWEWFHNENSNSQLWDQQKLKELGILE